MYLFWCRCLFSVSFQCAVCSVPCAMCRVPCAVCCVPCAVCSVPCAVCSVLFKQSKPKQIIVYPIPYVSYRAIFDKYSIILYSIQYSDDDKTRVHESHLMRMVIQLPGLVAEAIVKGHSPPLPTPNSQLLRSSDCRSE